MQQNENNTEKKAAEADAENQETSGAQNSEAKTESGLGTVHGK